jgi:hypothetical protein
MTAKEGSPTPLRMKTKERNISPIPSDPESPPSITCANNPRLQHIFVQPWITHMAASKLLQSRVFAHVFTQMSSKSGIKKHGNAAVDAMMAEFTQLENMSVHEALDLNTLTNKQKLEALRSINLKKEKLRW